ncbi:hypothetical protein GFS60_06396 (plasmid) [Rhodococcus sp. WAY2]|nr:hypothetical protein GFS60_06396 [Rhodococcus sp. WAY2]
MRRCWHIVGLRRGRRNQGLLRIVAQCASGGDISAIILISGAGIT